MKPKPRIPRKSQSKRETLFAALFGMLLGLALLKFGNAAIMEKFVEMPQGRYEWLLNSWPVRLGFGLLIAVSLVGLALIRRGREVPLALVLMPAAWLVWQLAAGMQSVDPALTQAAFVHFVSCVACFYLGLFALARVENLAWFWMALLAAFLVMVAIGLHQHFGGLEESRRYFYLYIYPQMKEVQPEYLKKIDSDRIFATLFYPNSLAGAVLLYLPILSVATWQLSAKRFTLGARRFLVGLVVVPALACLYWSGSKAGWLLLILLALVALLHVRVERRFKLTIVAAVLVLGLAGFIWKYAGFFQRGATSVSARFDYWQAAIETMKENPIFGTGPGTFAIAYTKVKRPESEMARLTHNDYLQQASDSGLIGFLTYLTFILGSIYFGYLKGGVKDDPMKFAVWLGLLGWSSQGLVEFGLYIPALAWPAFGLMGWLLGQAGNQIDSPSHSS